MFKRILLGITFVAALGVAGLGISDTAEARRLWTVGYAPQTYYVPSYGYYRPAYPYRAYYPRVVQPYPYQYYYGPSGYYQSYYYPPRSSVYFSFGF